MAVYTKRVIVYHIPKTGGTWVKAALRNAGIRYRAARTMPDQHPFNLRTAHSTPDNTRIRYNKAELLSITFVRHPVEWYRSYWAYIMREGAGRDGRFPATRFKNDDFNVFVNGILDAHPGGFVTQLYQYYTGVDCDKVDFIGWQENLAGDLLRVLRMAGEDFDERALLETPPERVSPKDLRDLAIPAKATEARVLEAERWVMGTFYSG